MADDRDLPERQPARARGSPIIISVIVGVLIVMLLAWWIFEDDARPNGGEAISKQVTINMPLPARKPQPPSAP